MIAAGEAVGITTEATAAQHRRPGVVYRPVRDAAPVEVHLAWWAAGPPPALEPFVALVRGRPAGYRCGFTRTWVMLRFCT